VLSCFRAGSPAVASWEGLEIWLSDLLHRLRFGRELGLAVVSSESVSRSVHHRKLKIPLQWHEFQEPANLVVCALEYAARSGIYFSARAKRLDSECDVHGAAQPREARQVPLVQEAHSVWPAQAAPSPGTCSKNDCASVAS